MPSCCMLQFLWHTCKYCLSEIKIICSEFFSAMVFCAETQDAYSPVSCARYVQDIVTVAHYSMCALK